jgi:hypothetical protein
LHAPRYGRLLQPTRFGGLVLFDLFETSLKPVFVAQGADKLSELQTRYLSTAAIQFTANDMKKYMLHGPRNYTLIFFLTSLTEKYPCPACVFVDFGHLNYKIVEAIENSPLSIAPHSYLAFQMPWYWSCCRLYNVFPLLGNDSTED